NSLWLIRFRWSTWRYWVDIGQLSILLVALPVLICIRGYQWYKKWLMPVGSFAIALIALQWSIERF
ncbi:MAG: hypothetical protein ACTH36_11680, partial [Pseudoalteromonas nigrifaciens]